MWDKKGKNPANGENENINTNNTDTYELPIALAKDIGEKYTTVYSSIIKP